LSDTLEDSVTVTANENGTKRCGLLAYGKFQPDWLQAYVPQHSAEAATCSHLISGSSHPRAQLKPPSSYIYQTMCYVGGLYAKVGWKEEQAEQKSRKYKIFN
jgi:hypothetical protein